MKKRNFLFFLSALFIFTTPLASNVSASNQASEKSFSVSIVKDDSQLIEDLPYFHYQVKEATSYTNKYNLQNHTEQEKIIDIIPVNAFTNPFASFNFTDKETSDLSTFIDSKRKFSSMVDGPSSVTLGPLENKEISLTVTTPEGVTDGEIVGAVIFEEENQASETSSTTSTTLKSKINFIISTLLEYEKKEVPLLSFGKVEFNSDYAIPRLEVEVVNEKGSFLKESTLTYKVFSKNDSLLFEGSSSIERFAPSTNVLVPVNWENEYLKVGNYYIEMSFTSENDEFKTISTKKDFVITNEMLKKHQVEFGEERIIPTVDLGSTTFYVLLLLVGLMGISAGIYWMKRKERALILKYSQPESDSENEPEKKEDEKNNKI